MHHRIFERDSSRSVHHVQTCKSHEIKYQPVDFEDVLSVNLAISFVPRKECQYRLPVISARETFGHFLMPSRLEEYRKSTSFSRFCSLSLALFVSNNIAGET